MTVTTAPENPQRIKLYNLPQRVEGGIRIHGYSSPAVNLPEGSVLLFDYLDGMYANCTVEGLNDGTIIHLHATTPLIELGGDEYKIDGEPEVHEEDEVPSDES